MRQTIRTALALATLAAGATGAAADAVEGEDLAAEYCARCHDITAAGAPKTWPPSFASIAWFRADDQIHARILFPNLHTPMPAWQNWLAPDEITSLVDYIRTLEPAR